MSFFPIKFQTEDGFTYYVLYSGQVVDSLDPETVDMSWPNVESFLRSQDMQITGEHNAMDTRTTWLQEVDQEAKTEARTAKTKSF